MINQRIDNELGLGMLYGKSRVQIMVDNMLPCLQTKTQSIFVCVCVHVYVFVHKPTLERCIENGDSHYLQGEKGN